MRVTASTDAATTAPAAGLLSECIQILGRCSSDCYRACSIPHAIRYFVQLASLLTTFLLDAYLLKLSVGACGLNSGGNVGYLRVRHRVQADSIAWRFRR